jgi:hypothetical protein
LLDNLAWHLGGQELYPGPVSPRADRIEHAGAAGAQPGGSAATPGLSHADFYPEFPPDTPYTRKMYEMLQQDVTSEFNGYKLRAPHIQEAIRQAELILPRNIQGIEEQPKREHGLIFHDHGDGNLVLGGHEVGEPDSVEVPLDIHQPTARVHLHTHPYSPDRSFHDYPGMAHDYPSMPDQVLARAHPAIDFLVQIPAEAPGAQNEYIILKGSHPPRFHLTVPNPDNLPVPPHSPDGDHLPPYREHPVNPYTHFSRFEERAD